MQSRQIARGSALIFIAYLLIGKSFELFTGEQLGLVDEATIVAFLAYALTSSRGLIHRREFNIMLISLAIFALGALSHYANSMLVGLPHTELILTAALIDLKPYILTAAMLMLMKQMNESDSASFIAIICASLIILASINLLFCILDIFRGTDIHGRPLLQRVGLPMPAGIFHHKFMASITALFGFVAAMAQRRRLGGWFLPIAGLMLFAVFISLSAGPIIASMFLLVLSIQRGRIGGRFIAMLGALLLAVVTVNSNNPISEALNDRFTTFSSQTDDTVRTALYIQAPNVANDFAPLGSGWGTFGSSASRDIYYSPLYRAYGISRLWGGSPKFGDYLVDTFWPKILAEQGWIGFVLYISLWIICGKQAIKLIFLRNRTSNQDFAMLT